MSVNFLNEIIRYEKDDFKTPNIYGISDNNLLIACENFRKVHQNCELFLFLSYKGQIYFPLWFEFRSINNNLLFLFEELEIDSFDLLQRILNSSLEKEEKWTTQMKAIIYHVKQEPTFSFLLKRFKIEEDFQINISEN